jgi:RNA polymerase sigma-70 factor (ECF subfamily)
MFFWSSHDAPPWCEHHRREGFAAVSREQFPGREHCDAMTPAVETIPVPPSTGWRALGDLPDDRLVALARAHDLLAFEALMRRHNRRLFRVARSVLRDGDAAQDAVQETYLRVFTKLDSYEPSGKFGAWIARVALNEALMIRRRQREDISLDDAGDAALVTDEVAVDEAPTADQFVEAAHARALLEHAIDTLPENFRTVYMLRAVEGLDVRETAECLGVNAATVRTRLFRAQRLLRVELSRRLQGESTEIFDFGAERCDRVVAWVLAHLGS